MNAPFKYQAFRRIRRSICAGIQKSHRWTASAADLEIFTGTAFRVPLSSFIQSHADHALIIGSFQQIFQTVFKHAAQKDPMCAGIVLEEEQTAAHPLKPPSRNLAKDS